MSIHCGACGIRLYDATENYGGFQVNGTFSGWHQELGKSAKLSDTCKECFDVIAKAATDAANAIVAQHASKNEQLRNELHAARAREDEFLATWGRR